MEFEAALYGITNALQPVRRAWVQAVGRVLSSHGLSTSLASAVLFTSRLGPAVQQKTLALEIGVNPAALVRVLDQGEAAGLLMRSGVEGDRRSKVIDLLPEGQRLADRMELLLKDFRREILGDVPIEDVETATRVLRLLESRALAWLQDDRNR